MHNQTKAVRALIIGGLGAALFLAGCGGGGSDESSSPEAAPSKATPRLITATAQGTAEGVPDNLSASVSINNGGPSAAEVMADNNEITQKLIDQLASTGVDDKDVATRSVSLSPNYDDEGKIVGYVATNSLRITFRDLSGAGARLDTLVKIGGNSARVDGVALGFNDDDTLVSSARVDAVKRARAQADEMAEAAGAELGKVHTITDVVTTPYPYGPAADEATFRSEGTASSVPIAPGSQELEVQVRVVFELR